MASVIAPHLPAPAEFLPQKREHISENAEICLRQSTYYELRGIQCTSRDGTLILSGGVSSFYLKQIAQTLVSKLAGVLHVDNQIVVSGD